MNQHPHQSKEKGTGGKTTGRVVISQHIDTRQIECRI